MESTETTGTATYEVGDIVRYTEPDGIHTHTGPVIAKRTMKATGKTFYTVGAVCRITTDMLEKVEG